jgi:hypothetical protein
MRAIPSIESIVDFEILGLLLLGTPPDGGLIPPPQPPVGVENAIFFDGLDIYFNGQSIVYN